MSKFGAILIALIQASAYASDVASQMPREFLGTWDESLIACRKTFSEMRLKIMENEIRFYESGGPLKAIVTRGSKEVAVIAELSGEGDTWLAPLHFSLSKDYRALSDLRFDKPVVRYRCHGRP